MNVAQKPQTTDTTVTFFFYSTKSPAETICLINALCDISQMNGISFAACCSAAFVVVYLRGWWNLKTLRAALFRSNILAATCPAYLLCLYLGIRRRYVCLLKEKLFRSARYVCRWICFWYFHEDFSFYMKTTTIDTLQWRNWCHVK